MLLCREVLAWLRYRLTRDPVCFANGVVVEEIPASLQSLTDTNDGSRTLALYRAQQGYTPRIEVRFTGLYPQIWSVADSPLGTYVTSPVTPQPVPGGWRSWDVSDTVEYLMTLAKAQLCNCPDSLLTVLTAAKVLSKEEVLKGVERFDKMLGEIKPGEKFDATKFYGEIKNLLHVDALDWLRRLVDLAVSKALSWDILHRLVENDVVHRRFFENPAIREKVPPTLLSAKAEERWEPQPYRKPTLKHVTQMLTTVRERVKTGKAITAKEIDAWLKKNAKSDIQSFVRAAVDYFDERKLKWEDLDLLEKEYPPGRDIVAWDQLRRLLNEESVYKKLPARIQSRVRGEETQASVVRLGQEMIKAFRSGEVEIEALDVLAAHDPAETTLPWSLIRRYVVAFGNEAAEPPKGELPALVASWLESANLISPLYQTDEQQKLAILDAVKKHTDDFAKDTIRNTAWVKEIAKSLAGITNPLDIRRELQVEFDMWLVQALSPSKREVPLSPHAFTAQTKSDRAYQAMFDQWYNILKKTYQDRIPTSIKSISIAMQEFYHGLQTLWKQDDLRGYAVKAPRAKRIGEITKMTDRPALLNMLLEDVESELGVPVPADVREKLFESPYFNIIFDEVIFQSVKLP